MTRLHFLLLYIIGQIIAHSGDVIRSQNLQGKEQAVEPQY